MGSAGLNTIQRPNIPYKARVWANRKRGFPADRGRKIVFGVMGSEGGRAV